MKKSKKQLSNELEALRTKLYRALERANGNQQDPMVMLLSVEFDKVLNKYRKGQAEESA